MDRTVILIDSILILFYNKTYRFDQNSNFYQKLEHGALKGFSDSVANLDN